MNQTQFFFVTIHKAIIRESERIWYVSAALTHIR